MDGAAGKRVVVVDAGVARASGFRSPVDAIVGRGGGRRQLAGDRVGSWSVPTKVCWCGLAVAVLSILSSSMNVL
jgi:hypothetical protein